MSEKYVCQYHSNERKVCGRECKHPKGYYIHRKRCEHLSYKLIECELPMAFKHRLCKFHINKSYSKKCC